MCKVSKCYNHVQLVGDPCVPANVLFMLVDLGLLLTNALRFESASLPLYGALRTLASPQW